MWSSTPNLRGGSGRRFFAQEFFKFPDQRWKLGFDSSPEYVQFDVEIRVDETVSHGYDGGPRYVSMRAFELIRHAGRGFSGDFDAPNQGMLQRTIIVEFRSLSALSIADRFPGGVQHVPQAR